MYKTTEEMFNDFERDLEAVILKTSQCFEVSESYVRHYIKHLYESQRDNPRAFAYFEAEFGLFHRTLDHLESLQNVFEFKVDGADVLDVGCNCGHSLRAFSRMGAKGIVGLEYELPRFESCKFNLDVHQTDAQCVHGSILDPNLDQIIPQKFDLITCLDVLEHVPSIDGVASAFAQLVKPGGVVLVTVGNRFHPEMMLNEPHYGLPGMTLLPRSCAENYCRISRNEDYDVHHWPTRFELETIFEAKGFVVQKEVVPPRPEIVTKLNHAISVLRETEYPSASIQSEVLSALGSLEAFKNEVRNPEDFFGSPIITIFARMCD